MVEVKFREVYNSREERRNDGYKPSSPPLRDTPALGLSFGAGSAGQSGSDGNRGDPWEWLHPDESAPTDGDGMNKVREELFQLGKKLYGEELPAHGYLKEGFAEFVKMLVLEKLRARFVAPNAFEWWQTGVLDMNPEFKASFLEAQESGNAYRARATIGKQVGRIERWVNMNRNEPWMNVLLKIRRWFVKEDEDWEYRGSAAFEETILSEERLGILRGTPAYAMGETAWQSLGCQYPPEWSKYDEKNVKSEIISEFGNDITIGEPVTISMRLVVKKPLRRRLLGSNY